MRINCPKCNNELNYINSLFQIYSCFKCSLVITCIKNVIVELHYHPAGFFTSNPTRISYIVDSKTISVDDKIVKNNTNLEQFLSFINMCNILK